MNLVDADPAAAERLVDDNWLALARFFVAESSEDGSVEESPTLFRFTTGLASGFLNGVLRASVDSPEAAAALARETTQHFRAKGVPWRWYVVSASRPAELPEWLDSAGLVRLAEMTVMAADLHDLADVPTPPELEIREVLDAEGLEGFLAIRRGNHGMDDRTIEGWRRAHGRAGPGVDRPLRTFVGYLDGAPVASTVLFQDGISAGIYHVDVLERARRRGYGAALTLAACRAGRESGRSIAVLCGSALGRPVYARLGFRSFGLCPAFVAPG